MLSDALKKNVDGINELWKRLIAAYSNTYASQEDGNIIKRYTFREKHQTQ